MDRHDGLHGKQNYRECRDCHVEHQGVDVELVYWKDGMHNFDHNLTGYTLEGKHATLKCRDCHVAKNIADKTALAEAEKDLTRTFLGLDPRCLTCHADEHHGQLAATCANCHNYSAWKPAPTFDHAKAKYVLTGKHLQVKCDKCHLPIPDSTQVNQKNYAHYTGLKFQKCIDCHKDAHDGRLGTDCEKCHNPDGWGVTQLAKFDHSKTRYPLLGLHGQLTCDKCHKRGEPVKGLHYQKCLDCHTDIHLGEFADRPQKGACEECHSVKGFKFTSFTLEMHQQTKYKLQGSHQAVSCDLCHSKTTPVAKATGKRFTFNSTRCSVCHSDVHKNALDKFVSVDGCELCHDVAGWRTVKFDHSRTKFALEGKHIGIVCRDCHNGKDKKVPVEQLKWAGVSRKCEDCHKDNHHDQFSQVAKMADSTSSYCERCHTVKAWTGEKFNHNRDSQFKLEGAHQKVACAGCHKKVQEGEVTFVRYKPLSSACKSCHAEGTLEEKGKTL